MEQVKPQLRDLYTLGIMIPKKKVKICRMQPLYGPRCIHDMLPYRVFNSILNDIEFTKYGDGDAIRDWLYVEDAVDAIFKIIYQNK